MNLAEGLLAQTKKWGVSLVGSGGLLNQLARKAMEAAVEPELTERPWHEHKQTPIAKNLDRGTRVKTVLTEVGPVETEAARDREGQFQPVIVPNPKRHLDGIDEIVHSLSARGFTTEEILAHFDEVY